MVSALVGAFCKALKAQLLNSLEVEGDCALADNGKLLPGQLIHVDFKLVLAVIMRPPFHQLWTL